MACIEHRCAGCDFIYHNNDSTIHVCPRCNKEMVQHYDELPYDLGKRHLYDEDWEVDEDWGEE